MHQQVPADTTKKLWWIPVVVVVCLLLALAATAVVIYKASTKVFTGMNKPMVDADAGFKRAEQTIDPEALRSWALDNIHKKASPREITDSMPKYIQTLYDEPPEAQLDQDCLILSWGGGFSHWVFYVGDTNQTMPFNSPNHQYPYNFEWRPGIYYTREANWEKLQ